MSSPLFLVLAEILVPNDQRIRRAIRAHSDVVRLEQVALLSGMVGLVERARHPGAEVGWRVDIIASTRTR